MSERDSDVPPPPPLGDASWNDHPPADDHRSDPPPKPADAIRRIDTMLGSHLPGLVEKEVLEQAAASMRQEQRPTELRDERRAPPPPAAHRAPTPSSGDPAELPKKWRSPLQAGPDWLVALKSIPPKLVAIAIGGVVVGVLFTLSIRGCGGDRRYDSLSQRVALLEKTVGVSPDGGLGAGASSTARTPIEIPSSDSGAPTASASTGSAPPDAACASAKTEAFTAWQNALGKAKQIAGPAEAQCSHILTSQHRQTCLAVASAGVRLVQVARDTAMKGGPAARSAVKNVRDDGRNGAIIAAKTASQAAFAACPEDDAL